MQDAVNRQQKWRNANTGDDLGARATAVHRHSTANNAERTKGEQKAPSKNTRSAMAAEQVENGQTQHGVDRQLSGEET